MGFMGGLNVRFRLPSLLSPNLVVVWIRFGRIELTNSRSTKSYIGEGEDGGYEQDAVEGSEWHLCLKVVP